MLLISFSSYRPQVKPYYCFHMLTIWIINGYQPGHCYSTPSSDLITTCSIPPTIVANSQDETYVQSILLLEQQWLTAPIFTSSKRRRHFLTTTPFALFGSVQHCLRAVQTVIKNASMPINYKLKPMVVHRLSAISNMSQKPADALCIVVENTIEI